MNSKILLPIAGRGARFEEEGFTLPKPLIPFGEKTILTRSLESLVTSGSALIFVAQIAHLEDHGLGELIRRAFPSNTQIIAVNYVTDGALSSCMLARDLIDNDERLTVFTPDCYFEPRFNPFEVPDDVHCLLGTFSSRSSAHSYAVVDESTEQVTRIAEKEVISEHAIGGLYYFRHGKDFVSCADQMRKSNEKVRNEFYIAPSINYLIAAGKSVRVFPNSRHDVLGTPQDLAAHVEGKNA